MATDGKGMVLLPGERETISMPGNKMSFVHVEPDSAYLLSNGPQSREPRARRCTSTG